MSRYRRESFDWECQLNTSVHKVPDIVTAENKVIQGLTVGQKMQLQCKGEVGSLRSDVLKFKLGKENQNKIKILEVNKFSNDDIVLTFTAYSPGKFQLGGVEVTDGLSSKKLSNVEFQVLSVVNPAKKPENPYGPAGPLEISISWMYYAVAASVMVFLLCGIGLAFYRRIQKMRLLEELHGYASALGSYNQFQKDLRKIHRDLSLTKNKKFQQAIKDIEQCFKMFLVRELFVPAHKLSLNATARQIKKSDPKFYKRFGSNLSSLLGELEKAGKAEASQTDFEQLSHLARNMAGDIHTRGQV